MARALIVGCGCYGRELGDELLGRGWEVRGTSRSESGLEAIRESGLEPALADPDRPGTILDLVGDVTAVVWLLGSAVDEPEVLAAIHGPRLESLLERLVDTPVRGFVYESVGGVQAARLGEGRALVERAGSTWHIPVLVQERDRGEGAWAKDLSDSLEGLLGF